MGLNRIAKTLASLVVLSLANTAQAAEPDRVQTYGYFRVHTGAQFTPIRGADSQYGLNSPRKYRFGNETDWAEIGWNILAYKGEGEKAPEGRAYFMIGSGLNDEKLGASTNLQKEISFQNLYVSLTNIVGDSKLWIGKNFYKRDYNGLLDFFYWSNEGFGLGMEDLTISGPIKFSYAILAAGRNAVDHGFLHDVQVRRLEISPTNYFDVGAGFAHPISENKNLNVGVYGNARWTFEFNEGKSRNQVVAQAGFRSLGCTDGFGLSHGGVRLGAVSDNNNSISSKDAVKLRIMDILGLGISERLNVELIAIFQHDAKNNNTATKQEWITGGGRVTYAFSDYASVIVDSGLDTLSPQDQDMQLLLKVTPAIEVNAKPGTLPHFRVYTSFYTWNDAASGNLSVTGVGPGGDASKKFATVVGVQGEVSF